MSKLSLLDESITYKDENYYVNKCHSGNKMRKTEGYGGNFTTYHQVEDKVVELQQCVVPNGEDDIDYELREVIIHSNLPF